MTDETGDHDFSEAGFGTRAVQAGYDPFVGGYGDAAEPIHLASTFERERVDDPGPYVYDRAANPTRDVLQRRLASLAGGEAAFAYASGTAAMAATALSQVSPGGDAVLVRGAYGGTKVLFDDMLDARLGVSVTYVDETDTDAVLDAVSEDTELVWLESPTNPLLNVCDLGRVADALSDHPATVVADNTFASPYFQRPLELGVDVVIHSTTKFLNGHSDATGGAAITREGDLAESLGFMQFQGLGAPLSAFDSYLLLRGLKSLPARMDRHEANATAVAEFLVDHPAVRSVNYPGLPDHPGHALAAEQMDGFGGVVSFEVDGDAAETKAVVESLECFSLAVSLGGPESLVEHTASMSAGYLPDEQRRASGITDSLVRAPVGLEDPEDLTADLDAALSRL
jgi:cystathionine beta-lyase/cystathionine gamma-synthase